MADFDVEERARLSGGISNAVIHDAVLAALTERDVHAQCLLDVGCGVGHLAQFFLRRGYFRAS